MLLSCFNKWIPFFIDFWPKLRSGHLITAWFHSFSKSVSFKLFCCIVSRRSKRHVQSLPIRTISQLSNKNCSLPLMITMGDMSLNVVGIIKGLNVSPFDEEEYSHAHTCSITRQIAMAGNLLRNQKDIGNSDVWNSNHSGILAPGK